MKKTLKYSMALFAALFFCISTSAQEYRKDKLFMPKGCSGAGLQVSYLDIGSTDSDLLLVLDGLNADGTLMSVAPFLSYTYKDNKAIGVKLKYSKGTGGISNADISFLGDDPLLTLEDVKANTRNVQIQLFRRSYLGLDEHGRFGLFNDIVLSYGSSRSSFSVGEKNLDAYSTTDKFKLGVCPGIMIFILNNVCTHVSMSIGGVSYTHTDNFKDGVIKGRRDYTKAHFAPDITDISMGLTVFF
ncbi:MAG: hypothetical protein ACI4TJ_00775 [Candidatus Cryptobacteroides sp.]